MAARAKAKNAIRMRSWRMDQIPDLCDDAAYSAEIVFKICCAATTRKVPKSQTVDAGFGSRRGTGIYRGEGAPSSDKRPDRYNITPEAWAPGSQTVRPAVSPAGSCRSWRSRSLH